MSRCALWAWPYFEKPVSQNGNVKLHDAKSALLFRCIFREYYEVVANSDIGETLINFGDKPNDMQDKISDLPVFGDTIYSPELFSDPNKTVESDDTTVCDNISDTLIAFDNENDTCTSISEEVDITHNGHGNIFAHHVPCNDDIIVISSDCENDSSVSILKKKEMER
jgi:hypothetical protein